MAGTKQFGLTLSSFDLMSWTDVDVGSCWVQTYQGNKSKPYQTGPSLHFGQMRILRLVKTEIKENLLVTYIHNISSIFHRIYYISTNTHTNNIHTLLYELFSIYHFISFAQHMHVPIQFDSSPYHSTNQQMPKGRNRR